MQLTGASSTAVISGCPRNVAVLVRSGGGDMSMIEASLLPFAVRYEAGDPRAAVTPGAR